MPHFGAGIVSYNPNITRLKENIMRLSAICSFIIIVDNGSENVMDVIEMACCLKNVEIITNSSNLGVGRALNQIVDKCDNNSIDWVLLLDQDSIVSDNIIYEYKKYVSDDVGLLSPYIIDINKITIEEYDMLKEKLPAASKIDFAITSGSLINISVFKVIGGFDEGLFIDGVDTDYSRRLSICGYKQYRINRTYILHEVGKAEPTFWFRFHKDNAGRITFKRYFRTNHSPERIYYMARNNIILIRRYKKYYSSFNGYLFVFRYMIGKALFEKNKKEVIPQIVRGIRAGFTYPENGYLYMNNRGKK